MLQIASAEDGIMDIQQIYQKTGYLDGNFRLFHIIDQTRKVFNYHYHDFHKIVIFLQGNVSYVIEGMQYTVQPNDIILIQAGEIHKPIIHDHSVYDRIIIYVAEDFFEQSRKDGSDLFQCFQKSRKQHSGLIRIPNWENTPLAAVCRDLAVSYQCREYASDLYQKVKFTEFLILINRLTAQESFRVTDAVTANPVIQNILKYINDHLTEEDLSIDRIAREAYLNRSYLMHLFKAETGYTIGKYISEKRLFLARSYISKGMSVTDACYHSGFKNYTTFYYAYKNKYGASPTQKPNQEL